LPTDLVRKQADRVDSVLATGNDPGPLAGVPVTVKLNIDQAGFATSDGSRLQENLIAKFNSLPWTMWCEQVQCCSGAATCQPLPCVGLRATCSMAAHTQKIHVIRS
jgi:hypothetical protein